MPFTNGLLASILAALLTTSVVTATLLGPGLALASTNDRSSSTVTPVESCGVIDEPGHYELTTDLESNSTCIRIAAPNVTLDGNGHTITGTGAAPDTAVLVRVTDGAFPHNVTVQNLTVEDWERGVAFRLVENASVRNVTATNASIVLNHVTGATVVGSQVEDGAISAVTSWDVVVRDATLRNASVELGSFVHGATVSGVAGDGASVSVVRSDNVTVRDSNLSGVTLTDADDVTIANNSPDKTGRFGVWVSSVGAGTVTVTGNHITGNVDAGTGAGGKHAVGIRADAVHELTVTDNRIEGNDVGVHVVSVADRTIEKEVDGDRVSRTEKGAVVIHHNSLANNSEGVVNEGDRSVNATNNYWGPGGPSSATSEPLEDPETGALADGDGSSVSAAPHSACDSNVRFDPWLDHDPTDDTEKESSN